MIKSVKISSGTKLSKSDLTELKNAKKMPIKKSDVGFYSSVHRLSRKATFCFFFALILKRYLIV